MSREYTSDLIDVLQNDCRRVNVDGLEVVVKPVPDDEREGVVDPRVFASAQKTAAGTAASMPPSLTSLLGMRRRPLKADNDLVSSDIVFNEFLVDADDHLINVYTWEPATRTRPSAVLFYLHGGGFTSGDVTQYRRALAYIAEQADALVVFPEYRLSPEARFPLAIEDCLTCIRHISSHAGEYGIDLARLVVAGDSAGGSLTNACILELPKGAFAAAVELYPLTDAGSESESWSYDRYFAIPEHAEVARGRVDRLRGSQDMLGVMYTADADKLLDPKISAMYATTEQLAAFPPTTVVSAEYDYLRIQDEQFAKKLQDAGATVTAIRYAGCDHGFFEWPGVRPQTEDVALEIAKTIRATA